MKNYKHKKLCQISCIIFIFLGLYCLYTHGFSFPDSDMHHHYFWENIIDILSLGVCHLWGGGRVRLSNAWNVGHKKAEGTQDVFEPENRLYWNGKIRN